MKIRKHGDKWEFSKMKDGIRYYVSLDFKPSIREAEEIMAKHIAERSVAPQRTHRMDIEQACNAYVELKGNVLSPSTLRGYKTIIRQLPESFKRIQLDQISSLDVQKLVNDISVALSPKSVRNAHGFISAVLSVYRPNIQLNTTLPQKGKFEPYTPIDEDVKRILDEVAGTEYDIPFRLAVYGMRRGEICAITAADLDGNILTINKAKVLDGNNEWIIKPMPKTTESIRSIYIDDALCALIRERGFAFQEHPNRLNKRLQAITKALDLPHFRFHDFRAYYASMAHAIGIPDKYIMAHCGWKSDGIMNRVYKRAQSDVQAKMELKAMEHLFGG